MYAREINGREYTFGVAGSLIFNGQVMYDQQTHSLWSQLTGWSVSGSMDGVRLEYLPSWQTTWGEWRKHHPDTLAADKGSAGSADRHAAYYTSTRQGIYGQTLIDERLTPKEVVLGIDTGGSDRAYPFAELARHPVINETVGSTEVLIVYFSDPQTALVYERRVDGQVLTFAAVNEVLTDRETGSTWDGWTGIAVDGVLEGTVLTRVRSTHAFWFSWKDWYPGTHVFGID